MNSGGSGDSSVPTRLPALAAPLEQELAEATSPDEREARRGRLVDLYLQILKTEDDPAVRVDFAARLLSLHERTRLVAAVLEQASQIANDRGDVEISRQFLEPLANDDDPRVRRRALERLGDLFSDLGDRSRAKASWAPAAQLRIEDPSGIGDVRRLYERILDTLPDDREAAERLVVLYAQSGDWQKIPEVLGVVTRADCERGAEVLLTLQADVLREMGLDRFIALADEADALLRPSSPTSRRLRLARARALAEAPIRHGEASAAYRAIIDNFENDDDAREYRAFIESSPEMRERRWERRWLYQWRAAHDGRPVEALTEWAKDEEENGEFEEAIAVLRRLLGVTDEASQPAIALKIVTLLEDLGRHDDAAVELAPLVAATPEMKAAHEVARLMLGARDARDVVAERFERIAEEASEASEEDRRLKARLLAVLVDAREETASLPDARRRWHRRALALAPYPFVLGFPAILRGALDMPDEAVLWDAAERLARELGQVADVVGAYGEVLTRPAEEVGTALAETLGRRMIALESESAASPDVFVTALERVLTLLPGARWALDRVKLELGSQARWEDLFRFYDGALDAADSETDRMELLHEAAIAARDLANDTSRAIRYYEAIRAVDPADAAVGSALARLYVRESRKADLIALLRDRAHRLTGGARHDLERRIAALHLELGQIEDASAVLDASFEDGAVVADVIDLLEHLARHRGQRAAIERLCAHYESSRQLVEVARLRKLGLGLAAEADERAHHARDLVRVRLLAALGEEGVFARVIPTIAADLAAHAPVAKAAYRALLVRASAARKGAKTDAEYDDALEGSWQAVDRLKSIALDAGDARGAFELLRRGARLPFERVRQRALLAKAVRVSPEPADVAERERVLRVFAEIFEGESDDPERAGLIGPFTRLLEAAGRHWETQEAWDRATLAYERASTFGAEASFEALARIHTKRGDWPRAEAALEWLCAHASSPEVLARHSVELARALVALDRVEVARESLEGVIATDPPRDVVKGARALLIPLYRKAEDWRALVDVLRAEAPLAEPEEETALFTEASSVLDAKLGEVDEAVRVLEIAIGAVPNALGLRPKLADLLERLGRWERFAEVLGEQVGLFGERRSKERAMVHHRLARALARLGRGAEKLVHLEAAARMHPAHPAILHDLASAALEVGDLDLAEKTYRSLLLVARHPSPDAPAPSGSTYASIFLDLGTIAQRKGDPSRAADLFESGLETALEAGDEAGLFEEALRSVGRHDLVARAVESRIAKNPDALARTNALRDLADLWGGELAQEPELGGRVRRYAEEIAPTLDHGDSAGSAAFAGLWSVVVTLGDEATLVSLVRNNIDPVRRANEAAPGRAQPWLGEAAALAVKIGDDALAARAYTALLEADPHDRAVWAAAEGVFERAGETDRLPALLERAIAATEDADDRVWLRVRLARRLGRTEQAIRLLATALEERLDEVEAATLLATLLDGDGRALFRGMLDGDDALRLLDGAILARPDDAELACLRAEVRARSGDDDGAIADLRRIVDPPPDQVEVIVEVATRILETAEPPLSDACAVVLADVLVRGGRTGEARLELETLLVRSPDHVGAVERVATLEAAAGQWDRAVEAYRRLLGLVESKSAEVDAAVRVRTVLALADACERSGRAGEAREPLERAVAAFPDSDDLERRLEHVCELAGDWRRLADLVSARAERTGAAEERSALFLRASSLLATEDRDRAAALRLAHLSRAANPESIEAGLAAATLEMALGRPGDAAIGLTDLVQRKAGKRPPLLATAYLQLGKAHLALDELAEAFDALKAGFAIDVRSGELAMLLGQVALDLGDEKTAERGFLAVVTLGKKAQAQAAGVDSVAALCHLASMAHASGDLIKARRWVEKAVGEDPSHPGAAALQQRIGIGSERMIRARPPVT